MTILFLFLSSSFHQFLLLFSFTVYVFQVYWKFLWETFENKYLVYIVSFGLMFSVALGDDWKLFSNICLTSILFCFFYISLIWPRPRVCAGVCWYCSFCLVFQINSNVFHMYSWNGFFLVEIEKEGKYISACLLS